ncbi:hypothetical protein [Pseudonocardia alni]|uniref:hypothetical protein n=1 Tax=Pseudonocardia alni TaxID=33907 RepID=UPI001AD67B3A|nr:hypothetical protein [Pseudonocardia alni]MBO4239298.1 hypothetical protein [Pseudonocardia alni]
MLIDGPPGTAEQAAALRELVGRLDDVAGVLAGIRTAVADAWDDPAGREWLSRLDLVGREVRRLADETAHDAAQPHDTRRHDPDSHDPRPHGGAQPDGTADPDVPGMRLPGLTGIRVPDRRGPVAPSLTPSSVPDGPAGR